jgi:hypothetical protein
VSDSADDRRSAQLCAKKLPILCGPSLCVSRKTLPGGSATPRPNSRRPEASSLPRVTKAKAKAVREGGDAPSHEVEWPSGRKGWVPGRQVPLAAVGEHHPCGSAGGGSMASSKSSSWHIATSCRLPPSLAPAHPRHQGRRSHSCARWHTTPSQRPGGSSSTSRPAHPRPPVTRRCQCATTHRQFRPTRLNEHRHPGLRPEPRPSQPRGPQQRRDAAERGGPGGAAPPSPGRPEGDATPAPGVQGRTARRAPPSPARPCSARPTDGGAATFPQSVLGFNQPVLDTAASALAATSSGFTSVRPASPAGP